MNTEDFSEAVDPFRWDTEVFLEQANLAARWIDQQLLERAWFSYQDILDCKTDLPHMSSWLQLQLVDLLALIERGLPDVYQRNYHDCGAIEESGFGVHLERIRSLRAELNGVLRTRRAYHQEIADVFFSSQPS